MALHGSRLPGISRSDRGRFLPLPDHRDTSLISWHCHSMTVAGRMPARASTAVARPAYRAKKRTPWGILHESHNEILSFLLSSRLYCRYRNLTGSAVKYGSRTVTAGRESHPAPKNFFLFCSILYAFICPISRDFSYKSQIQLFHQFHPGGIL